MTSLPNFVEQRANEDLYAAKTDRELDEAEAKVAIVRMHKSFLRAWEAMTSQESKDALQRNLSTLEAVLGAISTVYEDHPDYREDWGK